MATFREIGEDIRRVTKKKIWRRGDTEGKFQRGRNHLSKIQDDKWKVWRKNEENEVNLKRSMRNKILRNIWEKFGKNCKTQNDL